MVKFSKIGAAALALALTVTFVAPTQVKAWYAYDDVDIDYTTDADGKRTYKNNATGKTWTDEDDAATEAAARNVEFAQDSIDVETNTYTEFSITTKRGETQIDKIKAKSGKGNISFKVVSKTESYKDKTFKDVCSTDSNGKYYYYYQGKKIEIPEADLEKSAAYVSVTLRVYGKNVGKTVLQYKTKDKDGKVIANKKLTINVKDNASAITKITYGGKLVYSSSLTDIDVKSYDGKYGYGRYTGEPSLYGTYVTKKSGKIKVTAGKGYKVVAIYVQKDNDYELNEDGSYVNKKSNNGFKVGTKTFGITGDDEATYTWSKIKNGGKLTLSKVPDSKSAPYTKDTAAYTGYSSNFATTTVKVIVQNKKSKKFSEQQIGITLRLKK